MRAAWVALTSGTGSDYLIPMPRTVAELLDQADELAVRFELHEPDPANVTDAAALRAVRQAFQARAEAERNLADAVAVARAEGHSWSPSAPWSAPPVRPRVNGTDTPFRVADFVRSR